MAKKVREGGLDFLRGRVGGAVDAALIGDAERHMKAVAADKSAAQQGTDIHNAIESISKGVEVDFTHLALDGWRRWRDEAGAEVIANEAMVYSPRWGYAGTIDAICLRGNDVLLVDWKVSRGAYEAYAVQLAAYATAYSELAGVPARAAVVRLDAATGEYEEREVDLPKAWAAFRNTLGMVEALDGTLYVDPDPF